MDRPWVPQNHGVMLTNHVWRQLTNTLEGVLLVEIPSPFTDLELLCPQEAWIVVDLAYVRVNPSVTMSQRTGIRRVIAALETMCILGETLRVWSDLYEAFWVRVLTSDMNQEQLWSHDHRVIDMVRFMKGKGTHVAFRWRGKRLGSEDVIAPIRRFLHSGVHVKSSGYKPVQVALWLEDCELTTADLKAIHEVLKLPSDADSSGRLCDAFSLNQLSLRSNALYIHHHETLTALLEDPEARRIDSLCLDNTIPHDEILPPTYASIFHRTLSLALRTRPSSQSHEVPTDDGVSLFFDDCKCVDSHLIEAVEIALLQATRPVRALSLAGVMPPDSESLVRLMRLIHTPPPTATADFQLDITGLDDEYGRSEVEHALMGTLTDMVDAAIPHVNAALGDGVSCRLHTPDVFEDQDFMQGSEKIIVLQ